MSSATGKSKMPTPGESDYQKMGMGSKNLFVMYTVFNQAFSLPGVAGMCIALFGSKNDTAIAGVNKVVAQSAGPLYLSWWFLKTMYLQMAASLGTARRATGVNVPDQHVYKVVGGSADCSHVLMDTTDEKYGKFNRAQRALATFNEGSFMIVGDFFLAGFVLPWTTAICTSLFGMCRLKGALDYADEREKRMSGTVLGSVFLSSLGGIIFTTGIYATLLECRKLKV